MSDRVAVMKSAAIVQRRPHEIYEKPGDKFVADFIGTMNFVPGRVVRSTTKEPCSSRAGPRRWQRVPPSPPATAPWR